MREMNGIGGASKNVGLLSSVSRRPAVLRRGTGTPMWGWNHRYGEEVPHGARACLLELSVLFLRVFCAE